MDYEHLLELSAQLKGTLVQHGTISSEDEYHTLGDLVTGLQAPDRATLLCEPAFVALLEAIPLCDQDEIGYPAVKAPTGFPAPSAELEFILGSGLMEKRFDKLMRRVMNSVKTQAYHKDFLTLKDLLSATEGDISSLPGVGEKYVDLWRELKHLYEEASALSAEDDSLPLPHEPLAGQYRIHYLHLTADEKRTIGEVEEALGTGAMLDALATKDRSFFSAHGFKTKKLRHIEAVGNRIREELKAMEAETDASGDDAGRLLIPAEHDSMTLSDLDAVLVEDVEAYLDTLEEKLEDILSRRLGFGFKQQTLQEIADTYGLTRERIRQLESDAGKWMKKSLRVTPEEILSIIDEQAPLDPLIEQMETLGSCFEEENSFFNFLEYLCDVDIQAMLEPEISIRDIRDYFAYRGAPVLDTEFMEYLKDSEIMDADALKRPGVTRYLERVGATRSVGHMVHPRKLSLKEVASCVLADHRNGLPWSDAVEIIKQSGYCEADRSWTANIFDCDYAYLAGRGVYKHIKYFDISKFDLDKVFHILLEEIVQQQQDALHLVAVHQNSEYLSQFDYFEIRHLVSTYGEDYGFYFTGKSRTETISIDPDAKNLTQKDVIIEHIKHKGSPITKPEMARLIKSRSLRHASFYIEQLLQEKRIVQYDNFYSTPDISFADVDTQAILRIIEERLIKVGRPIEISSIAQRINAKLEMNYSKSFYMALAKFFADEKGWNTANNILSLEETEYRSLSEAVALYCSPDMMPAENYRLLSRHIEIPKEVALRAIRVWRGGRRQAA